MKFIHRNLGVLVVTILFIFGYLFPQQAFAQLQGIASWSQINENCVSDDVATIIGIECLFARFIGIAISLIGIAILVMLVIGAYQILFSGGDPKAVESGRNTITYAILGLIIAISAWFIINLIASVTGASGITIFKVSI